MWRRQLIQTAVVCVRETLATLWTGTRRSTAAEVTPRARPAEGLPRWTNVFTALISTRWEASCHVKSRGDSA